jgi:hypothetical protein
MKPVASRLSVKVVGANGQISLGKHYAGRQVLIEELEPGVWQVRTVTVIPDNERWLHEPRMAAKLQAAMERSIARPVRSDNTDEILKRLADDRE